MEGQRLSAVVTRFDWPEAEKLIAATVRVRGVCRTRFNNKRQMCGPFISVTGSEDIVVETPAPAEVGDGPVDAACCGSIPRAIMAGASKCRA